MATADSPTRLCGEDGCNRPHRARGLCSTHYNQQLQPERHKKITVPCGWCGVPCVKDAGNVKKYSAQFCNFACRDAWRVATGNNPQPSAEARRKARSVLDSRMHKAKAKLRKAARGTRGLTWAGGWCERCGASFVSQLLNELGRYCSDACKHRARASRRRGRERGAHSERYSRHAIFVRDGWRCHICKRLTKRDAVVPHPRAPTIDHLVALINGGDDTPANVATACFICNSTKSGHDISVQLALI